MGLTIHYTITPRGPLDATEARRLVFAAHDATARLVRTRSLARLSAVQAANPDNLWLKGSFFRKEDAYTTRSYRVPPKRGHYFELTLAEACETARFGLCEYPATLRLPDGRRLRTGSGGWRFHAFCKTQYASLHGWEPFFASHQLVIDAALVWGKLGCDVALMDEGDYWPRGNPDVLRTNLDEMNGLVAALGGALKDAGDEAGGPTVESPIFEHPRFEQIEAEGQTAHAETIRKVLGGWQEESGSAG